MPSVMTLEGAGRRRFSFASLTRSTIGPRGRTGLFGIGHFGDAWSDDEAAAAAPASPIETMTVSFVGWGILAFAVVTAAVRGKHALSKYLK